MMDGGWMVKAVVARTFWHDAIFVTPPDTKSPHQLIISTKRRSALTGPCRNFLMNPPPTTQSAAMVLLSAGSAQAPAPAAKPTLTAPAKWFAPRSFAEFTHNLLTRDTLHSLTVPSAFLPPSLYSPVIPFPHGGGELSWRPVPTVTLRGALFDGNTENTVPDVASTNPNAIENPFGLLALTEESLNWRLRDFIRLKSRPG